MSSRIPYVGKRAKITANKGLLSPSERHKKQKTPDRIRANSSDIAHRLIRDFTVSVPSHYCSFQGI